MFTDSIARDNKRQRSDDELKSVLENFSILLEKIIGVSNNGACAMSSMEVGVSGRLFQDIKKVTGRKILTTA